MTLAQAHRPQPRRLPPPQRGQKAATPRPLLRALLVASVLGSAATVAATDVHATDTPTRTVAPAERLANPLQGASETIPLEESERAPSTLAETVEGSPGVQVRRSGGGAAPAFVSVRGAPPNQVRVILDGVPLHGGADSSFDISRLPPGLFAHLTVHRSTPPLRYGAPLPGGALVLTSPEAGRSRASGRLTGGGRWEREALGLLELRGENDHRTDVRLRLAGEQGDWRWYDDGGTPFDPSDDRPDARRRNNASNEGAWLLRHRRAVGPWRLSGLLLGSTLSAGMPGPAGLQTTDTSRHRTGLDAIAAIERHRWPSRNLDVYARLHGGLLVEGFDAPLGELGVLDQSLRARTLRAGAAAGANWHPLEALHLGAFSDVSSEGYRRSDALDEERDLAVHRLAAGGGSELTVRVLEDRLGLRVGARLDGTHTGVRTWDGVGNTSPADSVHVSPLARIVVTAIERPWRVDAGVGLARASRVPSFHELFGDRGWAVGDPDLRPEERTTVDALLRFSGPLGEARGLVELGVFEGWSRDQIAWVQNAQGVRRPRNLDRVRLRGWEGRLSLRHGFHAIELAGTILDALQSSGVDGDGSTRVPFIPDLTGSATATSGLDRLRASWNVSASSAFFVDEANTRSLPPRMTHRADVHTLIGRDHRWRLGATLRNVFDARVADAPFRSGGETVAIAQPVTDALGFPLPGRILLLTLGHEAPLP